MEIGGNLILFRGQDIDCFYEKCLDGFLIQMGRAAFFAAIKFMVALPDRPAVLAVGMPHFRAVPASAVAAFYLAGEDACAALPVRSRLPDGHLLLHRLEYGRLYDGIVVVFHIILRDLALIDLFLFGEEIHRVHFLLESIPFVFFIGEDALDRTLVPGVLPCGAFDAESRQLLSDGIRA